MGHPSQTPFDVKACQKETLTILTSPDPFCQSTLFGTSQARSGLGLHLGVIWCVCVCSFSLVTGYWSKASTFMMPQLTNHGKLMPRSVLFRPGLAKRKNELETDSGLILCLRPLKR